MRGDQETKKQGNAGPDDFCIGAILTFMLSKKDGYFINPEDGKTIGKTALGKLLLLRSITNHSDREGNIGQDGYPTAIKRLVEDHSDKKYSFDKQFDAEEYHKLPYYDGIARRMVELMAPAVSYFDPVDQKLQALLGELHRLMRSDPVKVDSAYIDIVKECQSADATPKFIRNNLFDVFSYVIRTRNNNCTNVKVAASVTPNPERLFDLEVLRELCGYIPDTSVLRARNNVPLDKLYVETRLCEAVGKNTEFVNSNEDKTCGTFLLSQLLNDVLPKKKRILLLGEPGYGKTIALNAIAMSRYQQKSPNHKGDFLLGESRTISENHVFLMKCRDFEWSHRYFEDYVKDSFAGSSSLSSKDGFEATEATKAMLSRVDKGRGLVLLVDGLERISTPSHRKDFLQTLSIYMDEHPNVMAVVTATPDVWCGDCSIVSCNEEHLKAEPYMICHFNDEDRKAYCSKWDKLFNTEGANRRSSDTRYSHIAAVTDHNANLKKSLSSPLVFSYFLSIMAPEREKVFTSELLLISTMVDVATRSFIASKYPEIKINNEGDRKLTKYNIKAPIGVIAMYMNLANERTLPLRRIDRTENDPLSVEELLSSPAALNALDLHLSDRSFIRAGKVEDFIELIETYPFVRIERRRYNNTERFVERRRFRFTSSVFRYYFASYAIAKGCHTFALSDENGKKAISDCCGKEEDRTAESDIDSFLEKWCSTLCATATADYDDLMNRSIKMIADAAVLSRADAGMYVDSLARMAKDTSVGNRKRREIAVRCLLAVLSSEPSLRTGKWEKAIDHALRHCLYHHQLDDIKTIIQSAPRRELFLTYIYEEFCRSVKEDKAWPAFEWAMGHICSNWLDFNEVDKERFGIDEEYAKEFVRMVMSRVNETQPVNSLDALSDKILREVTEKESASHKRATGYGLALVASLCSRIWYFAKDTPVSELRYFGKTGDPAVANEVINNTILSRICQLIDHSDQRVANQACFSIVHCRTMSEKTYLNEKEVRRIMVNCDYDKLFNAHVRSAIRADYDDCEDTNNVSDHALCGWLRYFTMFRLTKEHYGQESSFRISYANKLKKLGVMDENGWSSDDSLNDDDRRKLMLLFRICFLCAAWEKSDCRDEYDPANALPAMKQLVSFRYPDADPEQLLAHGVEQYTGSVVPLGLTYDYEERFFENMAQLYQEICVDSDANIEK